MGRITMKRFNLDEYLKNPTRKVVTGTGRNVRIVCTDRRNSRYPIVALIEDEDKDKPDEVRTFTKDGCWNIAGDETPFDLFFAPERHEVWVNLYLDTNYNSHTPGACIYKSKKSAEKEGKSCKNYITTAKIEWEE